MNHSDGAASPLALVRLLQLTSPALPVGAYTYSQGLEWAVESGRIRNEEDAGNWVADLLTHSIGRYEAPMLVHLMHYWSRSEIVPVQRLNADFLASRESAELRAETLQMGFSLKRLLASSCCAARCQPPTRRTMWTSSSAASSPQGKACLESGRPKKHNNNREE